MIRRCLVARSPVSLMKKKILEIVCVCRDGQEALDSIVTYIPNVALLDIEMPKLNGLDVLDEVQKQGINTKIAILTTFQSPGYVRRALESGACAFITKDQDAEEVSNIIRDIHSGKVVVDSALLLSGATLPANPLKPRHQDVLKTDYGRKNRQSNCTGTIPFSRYCEELPI